MSTSRLLFTEEPVDVIDFDYIDTLLNRVSQLAIRNDSKEMYNKSTEFKKKTAFLMQEYFKLAEDMEKLLEDNNIQIYF